MNLEQKKKRFEELDKEYIKAIEEDDGSKESQRRIQKILAEQERLFREISREEIGHHSRRNV